MRKEGRRGVEFTGVEGGDGRDANPTSKKARTKRRKGQRLP